jgi:hypothetical protein
MALLCLLTNTPWPWPTPARAASAGCGKSGRQASRRPEEANTWSCTELFPSPCARQEQRSSARFGFLAGRGAQEIAFSVVLAPNGGALRGGGRGCYETPWGGDAIIFIQTQAQLLTILASGATLERLEHPELHQLFVEQTSVNTQPSSGSRFVAVGCVQRLLNKMAFPARDRLVER